MPYIVATLDEAEEKIKKLEPFRLRGRTNPPTLWATAEPPSYLGKLPPQYAEDVATADYVVISYRTPIGWEKDGEKIVPDVGYSLTTGQHQYAVAHAWGLDFRPARGRETRPAGGGPRRGGIDG